MKLIYNIKKDLQLTVLFHFAICFYKSQFWILWNTNIPYAYIILNMWEIIWVSPDVGSPLNYIYLSIYFALSLFLTWGTVLSLCFFITYRLWCVTCGVMYQNVIALILSFQHWLQTTGFCSQEQKFDGEKKNIFFHCSFIVQEKKHGFLWKMHFYSLCCSSLP